MPNAGMNEYLQSGKAGGEVAAAVVMDCEV